MRLIIKAKQHGFTLVEMAVVLVIIALILGGLLMPLSMQMEIRSRQETKNTMETIKEALIGFALTNGRLPCPDFNGDGVEDPKIAPPAFDTWDVDVDTSAPAKDEVRRPTFACADTGGANNYQGGLPYVTLGVGRSDAWNDLFTYRVSPEFVDDFNVWAEITSDDVLDAAEIAVAAIRTNTSLISKGNIVVSDRGDDASTGGVQSHFLNTIIGSTTATPEHSTANAAAVIISHGKNQFSGTDAFSGVAKAAAPANSDELTNAGTALNANNVSQKTLRVPTPVNGACNDATEGSGLCEFDDMVDWIAPTVLLSRMVAAGKLP